MIGVNNEFKVSYYLVSKNVDELNDFYQNILGLKSYHKIILKEQILK